MSAAPGTQVCSKQGRGWAVLGKSWGLWSHHYKVESVTTALGGYDPQSTQKVCAPKAFGLRNLSLKFLF